MVVCKCRKATKLYCFVHKQAVCHQCICAPEHEACVVKTYSEWVIDGDYDWPQTCTGCNNPVEEGQPLVRLGCLHIMHHQCLDMHLSSFPPTTAPAGFVCPGCNSAIWPSNVRDTSAMLFQRLKERIQHSSVSNRLLGPSVVPPSMIPDGGAGGGLENGVGAGHGQPSPSKGGGGGGALARKGSKQPLPGGGGAPEEYAVMVTDDEGDSDRKYARRGNFVERAFRKLLPGVAPPSLPIHSGPGGGDERSSGARRRRGKQQGAALDPRKLLLLFALLSCLATMVLLYTRIS